MSDAAGWTTQEIIDGLLDHHGVAFTEEGAALIARLQAVVDAARIESGHHQGKNIVCPCPLCKTLRAYDGESPNVEWVSKEELLRRSPDAIFNPNGEVKP
jgi:hypothetical protein